MKNLLKAFLVVIIVALCFVNISAQALPNAKPSSVNMSSEVLDRIDGLMKKSIEKGETPGAVVLVGRHGKVVFRRAYGNRAFSKRPEKMTIDTVFDMASLTKVVSTATTIVALIDQGKLRLNDQIGDFISDIDDPEAKRVTIFELLTHVSGYRPDFDLREKWQGREGMLAALKREKLRNPRGVKFVYSDINFIVLGEIILRVTEKDQSNWLAHRSKKIGMLNSKFNRFEFSDLEIKDGYLESKQADPSQIALTAPTEMYRGQQAYLGSSFSENDKKGNAVLRGLVHDPTSFRMNGIAGHAGLFSTADDMALFCEMILNGGELNGRRMLSTSAVSLMTKPFVVSDTGDTRGLGFDIDTRFSSNRGELFPVGSFGHTGFTGIGVWIDPLSDSFVVFLSNRVYPNGKGTIVDVRARISTIVASSLQDVSPQQIRDFESRYFSDIDTQIIKFRKRQEESAKTERTSSIAKPLKNEGQKVATVLNGIDVLEKENFQRLNSKKIGLVTNQTGRNLNGKLTIDILHNAKNVDLRALFSPEHGIRGELDQSKIDDSIDKKTGLKIYSLYGDSRRPKPEQIRGLDAIVFDIQDIGTRFYTYISTLRYVLEEAGKSGVKVFVLDRPNPINGVDFGGPMADSRLLSFVAPHELPVRHGMTIGEIAKLMNAERKIGATLEVVKMEGWKRSMWFDETSQNWVNPSPNMRSLTEATLYPGIGLLETTNLSVGRGTDTPFEVIGAPWIDGRKLAKYLNNRSLSGVRFIPIRFKPVASKYKNQEIAGVNIIITNRHKFDPLRAGFEIAVALRKLFPADWETKNYPRLLVNQETYDLLIGGADAERIINSYNKNIESFKERRRANLLY